MILSGQSIIGDFSANSDKPSGTQGVAPFTAMNPTTGQILGPEYISASSGEIERATLAAEQAFSVYGKLSGAKKALLLREIAKGKFNGTV